ncbi:hypothetical protein SAMN04487975_111108 [Planococcus glaciei]|uniref:hypothetical protein n=1 Tax=Planococcus glaciei TaxID=459472 RepID=UPI000888F069|nr:hypothetical protein [Planococcus glaciei]SDI06616.1 hypothetical protein SAMN04487975_111108 [Planococcus glaciei]
MTEKDSGVSILYLFFGTLGMIMVALAGLNMIQAEDSTTRVMMILIGIIVVVNYVYYLERKAGMSNKAIWGQSGVLIASIIGYAFWVL